MDGGDRRDRKRNLSWSDDVRQQGEEGQSGDGAGGRAGSQGTDGGGPIRSSSDRNYQGWNAQASLLSDPFASLVDGAHPMVRLDFAGGGGRAARPLGAVTNPNAMVALHPWQVRLRHELLLAAAAPRAPNPLQRSSAAAASSSSLSAFDAADVRHASSIGYPHFLSGGYGDLMFPASLHGASMGIPDLGLGLPYSWSVPSPPLPTTMLASAGLIPHAMARQWNDPHHMLARRPHDEHGPRDPFGRLATHSSQQQALPPEPSAPSAVMGSPSRSGGNPSMTPASAVATATPSMAAASATEAAAAAAAAAATTNAPAATARPAQTQQQDRVRSSASFPMAREGDETAMSRYQCMLRRQIEYFAATRSDLRAKAQGRNVKIRLGQVGIRCRHCSRAPPEDRGGWTRGAVYYPARLACLYQAVQNMSNNHYRDGTCRNAPPEVLEEIAELRRTRPKHSGGRGKRYFSQSAAALGIVDAEGSGLELLSRGGDDSPPAAHEEAAHEEAANEEEEEEDEAEEARPPSSSEGPPWSPPSSPTPPTPPTPPAG